MDVSPDGKIAVALMNDPAAIHPALLTTFDPILGTQLDSKTFGFGPLAVQLAQVGSSLRAVVLTSQGGPRAIYIFDISPTGKLTQLATTQLTTSGTDAGSELVLSSQTQTGFTIVASGTGPGMELITFSLVDGSILNRLPFTGGSYTLAMIETPTKRLLAFLKNPNSLEIVDAFNPSQPIKLGTVALNSGFNSSSAGIFFSSDARYVFVGNQTLSAVDLSTMQVSSTLPTNYSFGRGDIYEDGGQRLLAFRNTSGQQPAIVLINATNPYQLSIIGQINSPSSEPYSYRGGVAFSRDGSRLYVVSFTKLIAFDLPTLTTAWEQTVPFSVLTEHQIIVYGDSNEEVLGSWQYHNVTSIISIIGSFPAVPPDVSINDATTTEGNSGTTAANFTVTLSSPTNHRVAVKYATADGTARRGLDYSETTGTITFEPGETTKTISVPITGDELDEFDEDFKLNLLNASPGIIVRGQGIGIISDDDAPPLVSINDIGVTEGDFGKTNVDFTLVLSARSGKSITVQLKTTDYTAVGNGTDYFLPTLTSITFQPGETLKSFPISIAGDTTIELNEAFFADILSAENATIGKARGTCTIFDDDYAPTVSLSINDVSVTEGNSGNTPITFTVSLSAAAGKTVKVNYISLSGTAGVGEDFLLAGGTLTFAPGQTTKTVTVQVVGDTLLESDEQFLVELREPANATLSDAQGVGTIVNDDQLPIKLMLDESGPAPDQAAAIDSLLFLRDLFPVINTANLLNQGTDRNTRVIIFVTNLQLASGETSSSVIVNLTGSNNQNYEIPAEDVRLVPTFNFTQVIFRLPDNLSPGTCIIKVKAHGQESNSGVIRIKS